MRKKLDDDVDDVNDEKARKYVIYGSIGIVAFIVISVILDIHPLHLFENIKVRSITTNFSDRTKILLTIGVGLIGLIFLPVFLYKKLTKHTNFMQRTADVAGILGSVYITISSIFRLYHIESGKYFFLIGYIIVPFAPVIVYYLNVYKQKKKERLYVIFTFLRIVATIFIGYLLFVNRSLLNFSQGAVLSKQTEIDYTELLEFHPQKEMIQELKNQTLSLNQLIQCIKSKFIFSLPKKDSAIVVAIFQNDCTEGLMYLSASYRELIDTNFAEDIDTNVLNNPLLPERWEKKTFYHLSRHKVIKLLSAIQLNYINIEKQIVEKLKTSPLPVYNIVENDYKKLLKNHPKKEELQELKDETDVMVFRIHNLITEMNAAHSENDSVLHDVIFRDDKIEKIKYHAEEYKKLTKTSFADEIDRNEMERLVLTDLWERKNFYGLSETDLNRMLMTIQLNYRNIERHIVENIKYK